MTFYRRPSGTVCFRRVPRREDNGETDKSSCILIVTFLLKLSSQWVKYALACVYIDLPIGEMKKKAKMSVFIHNLARGRMATACFLSFFYQVSSAMAEENCRKERKGPVQTLIFSCTELIIPILVNPNGSRLIPESNLKCSRTRLFS